MTQGPRVFVCLQVRRLAMLTGVAVFKDILPGYRIRYDSDGAIRLDGVFCSIALVLPLLYSGFGFGGCRLEALAKSVCLLSKKQGIDCPVKYSCRV